VIGLPSLRTLDGAQVSRIWLAAEPTDMRCSFDRLAERVRTVIGQDPLGNGLFVFRSRSGNRPSFCISLQKPGSLSVLFP
jgi:transposase